MNDSSVATVIQNANAAAQQLAAVALLLRKSASDWRNTPAQINARANLASYKVRTAGVPDRFTRGGKRALQSAVLRANAMARATKAGAYDEGKHPRHPRGSDKGGEFAPKAHATYPDGRSIPEVGDSVYTHVPGFGGSVSIVEGQVYSSKKGLRVRVTAGVSYFGRGPVAGAKTASLSPGWTLKGEKSPFARKEEEREAKRKADEEAYQAQRKAEAEALAARVAAYQAEGKTLYSAGGTLPREGMRVRVLSHDPQYDQIGWVMEVSPPPAWSKDSKWTIAVSDDAYPTHGPRTTGNQQMVELAPDPAAPPPPEYVKLGA